MTTADAEALRTVGQTLELLAHAAGHVHDSWHAHRLERARKAIERVPALQAELDELART